MLSALAWTGRDATVLCRALHMTEARFARVLGVSPRTVAHWAAHPETVPRSDAQERLDKLLAEVPAEVRTKLDPSGETPTTGSGPGAALFGQVLQSFPASALNGLWVTAYQFYHGDVVHHHADISHVEAVSDQQLRAANRAPEPRTEGRANPFRNAIEAQLVSRHVIGHWKNTSDTRYFGAVHLAVLPGETVMDGYYTGFASDIQVSTAAWKWVRIDPESVGETDLATAALAEPSHVYDCVMNHAEYDVPLKLADVREDD